MAQSRRLPGVVTLLGLVTLAGSLGATWWWFNRAPTAGPSATTEPLDVYCSGRVDAAGQVIALEPATAGRVASVSVAEGDTVEAQQAILTLETTSADYRVSQSESALRLAELEVAQAKRAVERFPNQVAGRTAAVKAAGLRVEAARQGVEQRKVAAQSGPPIGAAELAGLEAEVHALEQLEAGERASLADFESMRTELVARVEAAQARKSASDADLAAARKARADCVLRAPQQGTILRLQATAGGLVAPGSPVPPVVFAPAGPDVVRAEVDQESVSRVTEGMAAEVRDENRPDGPVWRGRVRSLAGWVAQRRAMVLEPGEISDVRTVECVITLEPNGERLWIGQRMRVQILTESKPPPPATTATGR